MTATARKGKLPVRKEGNNMSEKHRPKLIIAYALILAVFTTYVVMDTFFITRVYGDESSGANEITYDDSASDSEQIATDDTSDDAAGNQHSGTHSGKGPGGGKGPGKGHSRSSSSGESSDSAGSSGSSNSSSVKASSSQSSTADSYSDDNIQIELKEYRENDTTIYVADVEVSSPEYLKTALAQGSYGRNVTAKTSETAASVNAILAINGDYYGAQEKGYVIRNGKLYRNTAIANQEDLVIYKDGSFEIINESDITAEQLLKNGAMQVLSFGPGLVEDGKIAVSQNEEVGQAMASNPRTAIGIIDENHYVFVVSDGRTSESEGLSLYELAQFMKSLGVTEAYNLDGGGSSTMYFNGSVVNNPTTGGSIKERSVSDIVYIGK